MIKTSLSLLFVALAAAMLTACGNSSGESSADTPSTASSVPFDRAFIDAMVPHHRAAIAMAAAAQKAGLMAADLNGIALDIADSQQREIDEMLGWRKEWYGTSTIDPKTAAEALDMSEEEMGMSHSATDIATATDVDAAFASMMIDHHEGAVAMARMALDKAERPEIKTLAQQIITAQESEIEVMKEHTSNEMPGMQH
jgi:uncharacterized protein (DUF305 family)